MSYGDSAWTSRRFTPGSFWPEEYRCAVTIGIHFDAETLWTSQDDRNVQRPVILSIGRFGAVRGVDALLRLLARYGMKATFFVPGRVAETYPTAVLSILSAGHTVAHHGYKHVRTDDPIAIGKEIVAGLAALRDIANVRPRGYAAPGWVLSPGYLDILVNHGFEYSANMMDDVMPYLHVRADGVQVVELPVHWLLDDAPFRTGGSAVPRPIVSAREVGEIWLEEFRGIYRVGGLFNLTLHPQVSGRPSMIDALELLLGQIHALPNVYFATCEAICDLAQRNG